MLGRAVRRLRAAAAPPGIGALLRLVARLEEVRAYRTQLRRLVPEAGDEVARLARTDPDAALATFVAAFQRAYVELDECICEDGFAYWGGPNDAAGEPQTASCLELCDVSVHG